jgi:hypothetical protein
MKHFRIASAAIIAAIYLVITAFTLQGVKENSKSSSDKTQLKAGDSYDLFINNINLPLSSDGVLADVSIGGHIGGGKFKGLDVNTIFLFSGGFYLSGYTNGTLWTNAEATSSRVMDYIHGTYATGQNDARAQLYVVKSSDPDFSQSWQDWKDAVALGAEFYDGDNDGVYNPVDKNGNGKWDANEDKPPLIGDVLVWCVYSDQKPSALRTFADASPQGIEIRQSVCAVNSTSTMGNMVFIKYNILNTGTKADVLDSVFFSPFADADIGDFGANDLDGCDTLLNSGYTYHKVGSGDLKWGTTPPCFMIDVLQGPVSYIPGKSFIDKNSNGIYDAGIDTPIDTAFIRNGRLGIQKFPGALNLPMSSFVQYLNGSDPADQIQARNLMMGKTIGGGILNPCTFSYGKVNGGVNCANVNPLFMYSGDPVTNIGWINTSPTDQRQVSNVGPFTLKSGKPVEIVVAYLVGRGTSGLNSITVAKTYVGAALDFYNSNYGYKEVTPSVDSVLSKSDIMEVNNFKLPVGNSGVLGDLVASGETIAGGKYNGQITLYSGGFYISGTTNGSVWSNGVMTATRVADYIPGNVGSTANDPKNINYEVNSSDPPFGQAWLNWKDAVSLGADFYDGNHDGIYNPVDLNGNGKWDPNEDRPGLMGDKTIWCVYNDGVPAAQRTFSDVNPQGIEIQQTVFAQKDSADLNNVIFIRYRLINKGTVADVLDSVYFGCANDADIGDSGANDLVGCDTLLNSGYTYHKFGGADGKWGSTPPAEIITLLQGPASYIPGVTFNDINGNGIFDPGTDIPIDTAFSFSGPLIGKNNYPGAKNLNSNSFAQFLGGGDPATKEQLRNLLIGKNKTGVANDPCAGVGGVVLGGINCSAINPSFIFSGDPVNSTGWICTTPADQKMILNAGPFKLEKNKPIDIMAAYIVGQGINYLNSITVAKQYAASTIAYYNSNFPKSIITGVRDIPKVINNFNLSQNYPNPFNPSSRIRYSVGTSSMVSIKVYNILGREVAVLLNEQKNAGEYEITFNSAKYNLASGVYFYKLTAGGNTLVKKMMLVK